MEGKARQSRRDERARRSKTIERDQLYLQYSLRGRLGAEPSNLKCYAWVNVKIVKAAPRKTLHKWERVLSGHRKKTGTESALAQLEQEKLSTLALKSASPLHSRKVQIPSWSSIGQNTLSTVGGGTYTIVHLNFGRNALQRAKKKEPKRGAKKKNTCFPREGKR